MNLWLAKNLSILRKSRKWTPHDFANTLQDLVSMEPTALKARLLDILENPKMDPTSLFAAQYAEAIKLRKEVDPVLGLYETLKPVRPEECI